jgi:hypothetical protein
MRSSHWHRYHQAWEQLTSPLRPPPEAVAAMAQALGPSPGRTLLLGVTPELAGIATDLVAVDRDVAMVAHIWPGDTDRRFAIVADWRNTNFADASFEACIGDGSLSGLTYPDEYRIAMNAVARSLSSGGTFVCRLYASPEQPETIRRLRDCAMARAIANFHVFKLRLGMALAKDQPGAAIGVQAMFDTFNEMFSDRAELARLTGWLSGHIDSIDFYRNSRVSYSFPTQEQVREVAAKCFPSVGLLPTSGYELAERCPLLIADVG